MIEKRGKRGFYALITIFILLNLVVTLVSNCYFIAEMLKRNYYITVELHSNLKKEQIKNFEKELLENNAVTGVKYLSKEQAFRELQKELEITIPKNDNQLPNSMLITFKNENNFREIQDFLDKSKLVREVYVDESFLVKISKKVEVLNTLFIVTSIIGVSFIYLVIVTLKDNISLDFMKLNIENNYKESNYTVVRTKNYIILFASALVGTLIFFNIYLFFKDKIQYLLNDFVLQSFNQLLLSIVVVLGVVLLFAINVTRKYKVEEV